MSDFEGFHDPAGNLAGRRLPPPDKTVYGCRVATHRGSVKSVRSLTDDTYELVVECGTGARSALNAKAGQYAALKVAGLDKPRSYSFARAPECEAAGQSTFFIRLVPNGKFSGWLFEKDRTGEEIALSGPLGGFGLDPSSDRMLCIAGGSGMSAIFSILEHACNEQVARDALFFYGARTCKDLYCLDELADIGKRWHPKHSFEFIPVLSEEPEDSDWDGARGFVTDYMKKYCLDNGRIDLAQCKAYFCGPPPMIDAGIKVLADAGMSESCIFYDKFEDASSPAPVIDNTKCVLCDECLLVKPTENCIIEVSKLIRNSGPGSDRYETVEPSETSGLYYNTLYIDEEACIRCYACVDACPANAISPDYDKTPKTLRGVAARGIT